MAKVIVCNYKNVNWWSCFHLFPDPKVYVYNIMYTSGSILGNPFYNERNLTRSQRIEKFRVYFEDRMKNDERIKDLMFAMVDLYKKGFDIMLVCACSPKPCHGDVIKLWIETMAGGIL